MWSRLLSPLRWLARGASRAASAVAGWLRGPLKGLARKLALRSAIQHLPAPLRALAAKVAPGQAHNFGRRWLRATLIVAGALGLVVAVLVSPVAAIIALPIVAIMALVRWQRRRRKTHASDATHNGHNRGFDTSALTNAGRPVTVGS
jgi:hypothetical protein